MSYFPASETDIPPERYIRRVSTTLTEGWVTLRYTPQKPRELYEANTMEPQPYDFQL